MDKKFLLSALSLMLFSCGQNITPPGSEKIETIIEISNQEGADVTVRLATDLKAAFSVKGSVNGTLGKEPGNIDHIRLVISTNAADPYNYPVHAGAYVNIGTGAGTINPVNNLTFKGLKIGSRYYIAARAFEDQAETLNITEGGTAYSAENVYVTGSGALNFENAVGSPDWDITVPLLNGTGAGIDTSLTANNGTLGRFSLGAFPVIKAAGSNQTNPALSLNQYGNGLAVWEDNRNAGQPALYARYIKDFVPDGSDFAAVAGSGQTISNPGVHINDKGNGIITWSEYSISETHIFYKHIVNYLPEENSTLLDLQGAHNQDNPKVSLNQAGTTGIVIWQSDDGGIYARGIVSLNNFSGFSPGAADTLISDNNGNTFPEISRPDPDGKCLAIWNKSGVIYGRKLVVDNAGTITGTGEFPVSQGSAPTSGQLSVSLNNDGNGLVVWAVNNDVAGRKIINYSLSGPQFIIENSPANQGNPKVSLNESGNGSIVWQDDRNDGGDIYGAAVINYSEVKSIFPLHPPAANTQSNPAVYINDKLAGTVIWQDQTNSSPDFDISGRRIIDAVPQ
jgi:hypothetical protein